MLALLTPFTGELAAIGAALIWAIASFVYTHLGQRLSPLILNITKGTISIGLILLTFVVRRDALPQMDTGAVLLLVLSGAIGIGMGDTAFFACLNCLGARRALLLEALAPPLTAVLALIFLQEQLNVMAWAGISLTCLGVAWVVVEQEPDQAEGKFRPLRGIIYGLIAAFGQASGAVLSRAALATTDISPLWSTLIRLVAGVLVLGVWISMQRQLWREFGRAFEPEFGVLRSPRILGITIGTAFAGTYLGIWLQQTALKYAPAGIAQSLAATSPLFVIPLSLWLGERVSPRAIVGVVMALGGIWLLFMQR